MASKTTEELHNKLKRDIISLSDANRGARRQAVQNIERALLGKFKPKPRIVTECFNLHLVEPLSNMLADPVEGCRDECTSLITSLVETVAVRDAYPVFRICLPFLVRRLGKIPFEESSEEIRLMCVELLHEFLKAKSCRKVRITKKEKAAEEARQQQEATEAAANGLEPPTKKKKTKRPSPLEPHIGDICQVLSTLLRDSSPAVKKASAAAINEVSGLFPQHMHLHLGLFVDSLLDNMVHAQYRVRRINLVCLGHLVACGAEDLPKIFREKIVPAMYHILDDHTPSVRKEEVNVLSSWLRARKICLNGEMELQSIIFSILLGAVGDDIEEVGRCAVQAIEDVAEAWYPEIGKVKEEATQQIMHDDADGSRAPGMLQEFKVPKPFTQLPSLAAQHLVCELMPTVLPPVLHSLSDWRVARRSATVAMLQALFIYAHRKLTRYLPEILQAIVLQICDDEKSVSEALCNCGETLGACVEAEALLSILLPWIRCEFKTGEPVQSQKNTLLTLASCVDGMSEGSVVPHLENIARTLTHHAVTACEEADVQFQVTEVVLSVVDKAGHLDNTQRNAKGEEFFFDLLRVLLNLVALGDDGVRKQSLEGIESLAIMLNLDGPQELYRKHFDQLLKIATSGYEKWERRTSNGFGFFESLLRQCDPSIVATCVTEEFMQVISAGSNPVKDATLRMQVLAIVESLICAESKSTIETSAVENARTESSPSSSMDVYAPKTAIAAAFRNFGDILLSKVLIPNLVWKVGRVEGTIRKLSVAALITVIKHGAISLDQTLACLGELIPTLTSTISDDYDTPMRHLSCIAMNHVLVLVKNKVGESFLSDLYPELLKRLDDSSDDVRRAIAPCLATFFRSAAPECYGTTLREYSLEMLLVHLDDQDASIQEAIFSLIQSMMDSLDADFIELVAKKASISRAQHRSPKLCDLLLARVEDLQGKVAPRT